MKMRVFSLILALLSAVMFVSCTSSKQDYKGTKKQEYSRNAVIYEVNIRQYTEEGTLNAFAEHLPYLKELGVDILWIMPVQPISELNRKGELGSYYAVADYMAVNPEFGTMEDFKNLVKNAHSLGMKVILDWVANHTGCDHVWIEQHPNWFEYEDGKFVSPWDWTDTYSLDYTNNEMRAAMIDAMKYWVKETDLDGFRCDVAALVPVDFWDEARAEIQSVKPVFMLAEATEKELTDKAFDMVYNWPLLFMLDNVYKGTNDINNILELSVKQLNDLAPDAYYMNHITNHDRNSWDGTEFERYGDAVKSFAVMSYVWPGMPLIYTGQEVGMNRRLEFFVKDTPYTKEKNEWFAFYQSLNELKHNSKALRAGDEGGKTVVYKTTEPNVFVLSRELGEENIVYIANISDKEVKFHFEAEAPQGEFENFFTKEKVLLPAAFKLAPWDFLLLTK
jgi:glycosidase